ncbi:unnamed protein product [Boreogadus saida]
MQRGCGGGDFVLESTRCGEYFIFLSFLVCVYPAGAFVIWEDLFFLHLGLFNWSPQITNAVPDLTSRGLLRTEAPHQSVAFVVCVVVFPVGFLLCDSEVGPLFR